MSEKYATVIPELYEIVFSGCEDGNCTVDCPVDVFVPGIISFRIPAGFESDGASIPNSLRAICGNPFDKPRVYAAIIHDFLYSGEIDVSRSQADEIYRILLIKYGVKSWIARIEYIALRVFGGSHFVKHETKGE